MQLGVKETIKTIFKFFLKQNQHFNPGQKVMKVLCNELQRCINISISWHTKRESYNKHAQLDRYWSNLFQTTIILLQTFFPICSSTFLCSSIIRSYCRLVTYSLSSGVINLHKQF